MVAYDFPGGGLGRRSRRVPWPLGLTLRGPDGGRFAAFRLSGLHLVRSKRSLSGVLLCEWLVDVSR